MRWLIPLVVLAGCADPAQVDDVPAEGHDCDYELDDYVGGQPFLMVHWDIDGDRAMSGIPFQVHLLQDQEIVASHVTKTDCALFDLDAPGTYRIVVNEADPQYCGWGGVAEHAYQADSDSVRVEMRQQCG